MSEGINLKFEEALQQLEGIVRALEGENLTLEEALERYQEGVKLVRLCRQRLQEVEGKLQAIFVQEGEVVLKEISLSGGEGNGN
ncbi:Exodeoxyribonuclease 7 small subunit [Moorella humiferrea]|uniref:Exodeoxyribonuclease 7 small subunit n=1 Tax=Neomoorella humiferrea TaxID=676965 RepID=A0A2T0AM94_9FIRM|nr:exodeoxyribonuclease VII small subunit [Moorella humiferrea]PRR69869.1 Exodeoxyribonuclease 7 small subunit [Moorella humiferrea]